MQKRKIAMGLAAALAVGVMAASPASAAWRGGWHGGGWHGGGWHGGWHRGGWGWGGAAAGLAAGAIVGSALAAPYYYGGYGYGPYAYGPAYDESYAAAPGYGGGDVAYCAQRFRSYDPSSGTYLGYDGRRHPCP